MTSEADLLERAHALAGRTVGELCDALGVACPLDQRRAKGLVGQLLERALGAGGNRSAAAPDFPELGVELKTLPIGRDGRPRESTFVCHANPRELSELSWAASPVRRKLARVLWVPVESDPALPLPARRIGRALLWSPSEELQAAFAADWAEIASRVAAGEQETIAAHVGVCLQLRPKAANNRVLVRTFDEFGAPLRARPRAFYLRRRVTVAIVRHDA